MPTTDTKSGTCIGCGCTDMRACPGGCFWVNVEQTKCSACFPDLAKEAEHDDGWQHQLAELNELIAAREKQRRGGKYNIRGVRDARHGSKHDVRASINKNARRTGRKRGRS